MEDDELLEQMRSGPGTDQGKRAAKELYRRHQAAIQRCFSNTVNTRQDVEDLLQQTFLICFEQVDRIRGSFGAYLRGIARNLLLRYWEKRRTRGSEPIEELSLADLGAGPTTELTRNRRRRRMLEALRQIPLGQQMLLEAYWWQDLTARELGELLGRPENTVRNDLRRARENFRRAFSRLENLLRLPATTDTDLDEWARAMRARWEAEGDEAVDDVEEEVEVEELV
jgi:RNA polymerase sigma factor (sigma-70 family)